jgi:GWxTD domain-containing protein
MRSAAILLLGLSAALPLQAQDRVIIAQLETLRDSLAGIVDSSLLDPLSRDLRQAARRRPRDPVTALRNGLLLLRRAELADGRTFSVAREEFDRAGRLEPAWPYPRFGVGLAELGRGRWLAASPAELGNRVGYGSYQAAVRSFAATLAMDHEFEPAGPVLARLAAELRDTAIVREALSALAPLIAADSVAPEFLLSAGRLERDAGDYPAAVNAFLRFSDRGGKAPLADLEAARSLLAMGQASGESLYYASAASRDSLIIAEYRSDLAPIAATGELALFDRLEGEERGAWLRNFWLERDRRDLRSPGERLREHYRRLYYARRHFSLQVNRRFFTSADLFRNLDRVLDDRGVVYVRQGEPDERISTPMFGLNGNETWVYRQPAGDMVLHFGAGGLGDQGGASDDYRLVASLLDLWRPGVPTDLLLLSRTPVSDLYNRMLMWGPYGQVRARAQEREMVEQSAITSVTSDDYQLRYAHPLNAAAELLVIGETSAPQLHVVFAVSHDSTQREPVRIRLGLFDAAMEPATALDTTVNPESYSPALDADLGHVMFPVPAGRWEYRLAIERGDGGRLFPTGSIRVGESGGVGLSDLVLAAPEAGIVWQPAPGDSVVFSPVQAFRPDRSIEVYYEVYGLSPGRQYETRIAVLESRGGRERPRVELRFDESSGGVVSRLHRTVQLNGLRKGSYWLEVRVRDEGGIEQRVRTPFQIL